jgi:hypothetical protein
MSEIDESVLFVDDDNVLNTLTHEEAINLLKHLRSQFKNRYRYLIGEWRNARRAKDTTNGKFVSKEEVSSYLNN